MKPQMLMTRRSVLALLASASILSAGCDGFFDKKSSSDNTTTGTGNYLYVANTGSSSISGYQIAKAGTLTAVTNSPYSISATANSLTVARTNKYLWVATASGIYGYSIGSAGALTSLASGQVLQLINAKSLETSPDGKWLIALNSDGASITTYTIASDGTLAVNNTVIYGGFANTPAPYNVRITPNGNYVYATLGTAGTIIYSFNTSTGLLVEAGRLAPTNGLTSDRAIAIAPGNNYLYLARSGTNGGLAVYSIGTTGTLTSVGNYATAASGASTVSAISVTTDIAGKYVYVANSGESAIYGFVAGSNGTLTTAPSSPYSAGSAIASIGAESQSNYIAAAAASGTPDVALFGFDATNAGRIYPVTSAAAGTTPSLIALTH